MSTATQNKEIAQTIVNQLKTISYWALGAWGARNYAALDETKTRVGGLQFDIKCPNVKNGRVRIELNGLDLYNVIVYRKTRKKVHGVFMPHLPIVKEVNNVYAEDMVKIIDEIVG